MEGRIKVSNLSHGNFSEGSIFLVDNPSNTEYQTEYLTGFQVGEGILSLDYTQELRTTAKNPIGAINEISSRYGVILSGVLGIGSTSLSFSHSRINKNSYIDIYASAYPINVEVEEGIINMIFAAKKTELNIKVVII